MPFNQHDLLRQAGHEPGDIVPLAHLSTASGAGLGTKSTTSTSFVSHGAHESRIDWDSFPVRDRLRFRMMCRVVPGTDETVAVRFRDGGDTNTLVDITGVTATGNHDSGWNNPTTPTTGQRSVVVQLKTDPGVNSSTVDRMALLAGVEL